MNAYSQRPGSFNPWPPLMAFILVAIIIIVCIAGKH